MRVGSRLMQNITHDLLIEYLSRLYLSECILNKPYFTYSFL
jgi:hypothetical protein